ncbi:MAG: DUF2867 domain-containing protein, partial [Candidatus Nanopelagicales bacterium]
GLAWLEFTIEPRDGGGSTLTQRAVFHPRGLTGHAYWWSVAPFHRYVFPGMAGHLAEEAETCAGEPPHDGLSRRDSVDPGSVER